MGGQLRDISDELIIQTSQSNYQIHLNSVLNDFNFSDEVVILADLRFEDILSKVSNKKIFLEAVEEKKSLESCIEVLSQLHDFGANKSSKLVAVGGGIIQDIATLVASLYMRGIDWVYFPTTKMSQFDSCIGGKSSINLSGKKNLIGNIYPPREIHIDYAFSSTLSKVDIAAGYLEAVKISFAHSLQGFQNHLKLAHNYKSIGKISDLELNRLVLSQKKYFVENDEFDCGIRQLLNFGHTFGHAIESASIYSVQHGIAIGVGMLMALNHPDSVKSDQTRRLHDVIWNILRFAGSECLESIESIDDQRYLEAFRADKKHAQGNYSIIIPTNNGLQKSTNTWDSNASSIILELLIQIRMEVAREIQR